MESSVVLGEKDYLACCGSVKFAEEMVLAGPFSDYQQTVNAARDIWFNKVDVNGWLEAFAAHPQIGESPSRTHKSPTSAQWSKGEQSTALATATDATLQELNEWNVRYRQKFGFVFLIFASGRSTPEILAEMKRRYQNRPIVEFELAAQEQMKVTEFRLSKLFTVNSAAVSQIQTKNTADVTKAGDRVNVIGAHLTAANEASVVKPSQTFTRTRPPITTHVLDVARGSPAIGIEVQLEMWKNDQQRPLFGEADLGGWMTLGSSTTDKDGRSGQLIDMVDALSPGMYRISFNTGKYNPVGFFPYVSIVFEVSEFQKLEHFHVPLLLSPFSFSTYRGS
ncbi:uric acid degradation bifunctional TTL isoform X2 [Olea europaea subsp. europaea]|uniref:Uric acid degradation bifunctional TTL isoform X2 n=1 Tax=Olea europaea subsp. europaea TaxID=158383 RepID=A0A8S0UK62_OLEEU|nr:uric acid degradation bifunctional TTL isoform X2 [Olea europaea subsp. europaea]